MTNKDTSTLYVRNLPYALHHRFKVLCTRKGLTLSEGITWLMREATRRTPEDWAKDAMEKAQAQES